MATRLNWREFNKLKMNELKEARPELSFGERSTIISGLWRDYKAQPAAITEAEPEQVATCEVSPASPEPSAIPMPTGLLARLAQAKAEPVVVRVVEVEQCPVVQWIDNPVAEPEVEAAPEVEQVPEAEPIPEAEAVPKPEAVDYNTPKYDKELVQCCKTWRAGGFIKACRIVMRRSNIILTRTGKGMYLLHRGNEKPRPRTVSQLNALLETVWIELCDTWSDYVTSGVLSYGWGNKKKYAFDVEVFEDDAHNGDRSQWIYEMEALLTEENIDQLTDVSISHVEQASKPASEPAPEVEPEPVPAEAAEEVDPADNTPTYDVELVECCKVWRQGGFEKASRIVMKRDGYTLTRTGGKYQLRKGNDKPKTRTVAEIREFMETVFIDLCDAWLDYTKSEDYHHGSPDAKAFDDSLEWWDVSAEMVTKENIEQLF